MYPPDDTALGVMLLIAMLGVAVWRDIGCHRIDNWITFPAAFIALCLHQYVGGLDGLVFALGGLLIGLVCFLPLHIAGGMAAGDVKLMAAAGAFLGPMNTLVAVALSLVAGSVVGIMVLAGRGGLRDGLSHVGRQLVAASMTRVWMDARPGSAAAQRFPYAIAIAIGCLATLAWQSLFVLPGMAR
jgi:prepilin peptidase CpaA